MDLLSTVLVVIGGLAFAICGGDLAKGMAELYSHQAASAEARA
jgi:hypothetical protein